MDWDFSPYPLKMLQAISLKLAQITNLDDHFIGANIVAMSTVQFISQVKLEELRRQRSLLVDAYDKLWAECERQAPQDALRKLYQGLAAIKIGRKSLHPDLGDIEILIHSVDPSKEIVAFWRRKLEAEWGKGRLRADIAYLFGALLGEWGGKSATKGEFLQEREQVQDSLLRDATTPSPSNDHRQLLNDLFAGLAERLNGLRAKIEESMAAVYRDSGRVNDGLGEIAKSQYQPAAVRHEAKRFVEDEVLRAQFHDALQIASQDVLNWTWPLEGIGSRALWTRNKWRLYLNQTLVELCLANCFGSFWETTLESTFSDTALKVVRLARLNKLIDLHAPPVIYQNEERMLRDQEQRIDLGWYEPIDPWEGTALIPPDRKVGGIVVRRAESQRALRDDSAGYYGYGANAMVHLVHVEVQTIRAAFPERPLFVAKLDLRNYFASIPHDVVLTMLSGFGLNDSEIEAIRRFLEVPYLINGDATAATRGVPMQQKLSHFLAEWLLRLMEKYVHERARVRIIRQLDDICLLSPSSEQMIAAWNAVHTFVESCGLEVNIDKCGTLAIGGDLLGDVPRNNPRWGLLELTGEGEWRVHEASFQKFQEENRQHLSVGNAVLSNVTYYNSHLRFLTSALGLSYDLGLAHRHSVNEAMLRFDADFFGRGIGIVAGLQKQIQERYLAGTQITNLPESWMYWPITAGGLSLHSALVLCGQYQAAFEERQKNPISAPTSRPENWQNGDAKWVEYYTNLFTTLEPTTPKESAVMKTLVNDFIARGQEISAGQQTGLSDYWRWILSIYGAEILDRFGTFRFLLTDLVPLQLIHEQLLHANSLDDF